MDGVTLQRCLLACTHTHTYNTYNNMLACLLERYEVRWVKLAEGCDPPP
jgi:hypothetical protein